LNIKTDGTYRNHWASGGKIELLKNKVYDFLNYTDICVSFFEKGRTTVSERYLALQACATNIKNSKEV
jgi:hypothetical protein